MAWHSLANFEYLVRPRTGRGRAREFLAQLLDFMPVAPTSTAAAGTALGRPFADFEDALQAPAAITCGADAIATRNLRHFARSPVPALSPAALLQRRG